MSQGQPPPYGYDGPEGKGQYNTQYGMAGQGQPVQMQPVGQYGQPGQAQVQYGQPGQAQVQYAAPGQPQPQPGPGGQAIVWMQPSGPIPGCPPGLEYLAQIDQLIAKQQIELFEALTGFETKNKYRVFNSLGQQVYYAKEESDCCMRYFCGPARGFEIKVTDNNGMEVMRFRREFKCCAGCCWCANAECCAFVLHVEAPPGTPIGYVRQQQSGWKPNFSLYTADDQELAKIHGPCCVCNCPCCGDVEFPVMSPDDTNQIGRVAKQWSGVLREWITDADTFSVTFPMDMDVRMKAVMFGALFLIDFMYFEKQNNN